MKYGYILQSQADSNRFCTGIPDDLDARPLKQNSGSVNYTPRYRPWRIKSYVPFTDEIRARSFVSCLKSGSGRALAKARS